MVIKDEEITEMLKRITMPTLKVFCDQSLSEINVINNIAPEEKTTLVLILLVNSLAIINSTMINNLLHNTHSKSVEDHIGFRNSIIKELMSRMDMQLRESVH